jgi:uncharacterized membrane protein YvbJ
MYCSGCGTQIQPGLVFCSRCGRRAAGDETGAQAILSNPTAVTAITAGVGFVAFILVIRMLTRAEIPPNFLIPITAIYFAALFGISFMLLRYGSKSAEKKKGTVDVTYEPAPLYMNPASAEQLTEGRPSDIGSVTDATTRTLGKVPVDRQ